MTDSPARQRAGAAASDEGPRSASRSGRRQRRSGAAVRPVPALSALPAPGGFPAAGPAPSLQGSGPEQNAVFSPADVDPPPGAVVVAPGTEVVFLEVPGDPVGKRGTVPQKFVYKICVGDWRVYKHGTGSDCFVKRENYHGTRLVGTFCPKLHADWSPTGTRREGHWRLRVHAKVPGDLLYLHKIAAFAFHRSAVPDGLGWAQFSEQFEGDHLPFLDPRGLLCTKPEWVKAGWVQAVPVRLHKRRTRELREARQLQAEAVELAANPPLDLEEKAGRFLDFFFQSRERPRPQRSLRDVTQSRSARSAGLMSDEPGMLAGRVITWSTLVGEAEREPSSDTDGEGQGRPPRPFWELARGCGPATVLLIRQPPSRQAHSLHLAYCLQRAREQDCS